MKLVAQYWLQGVCLSGLELTVADDATLLDVAEEIVTRVDPRASVHRVIIVSNVTGRYVDFNAYHNTLAINAGLCNNQICSRTQSPVHERVQLSIQQIIHCQNRATMVLVLILMCESQLLAWEQCLVTKVDSQMHRPRQRYEHRPRTSA